MSGELNQASEQAAGKSEGWAGFVQAAYGLLRLMRLHQWAKNCLLFVPIIAGHRVGDLTAWISTGIAFAVWGLMASAIYAFNDVHDLEADRAHPYKRDRPLVKGQVSVRGALIFAVVLGALALGLARWLLTVETRWWLFGYALISMSYLLFIKRRLLADVLALATLYTLRIMAGGAAAQIPISQYLLAFSMFLFASLAFAKRFTELKDMEKANTLPPDDSAPIIGRAYTRQDMDILRVVGPVTGYMAILVMAMYVQSATLLPAVTAAGGAAQPAIAHYARPELLYLICPLLAYWITRVWFIANRGHLHHDPLVFALKDPKSLAVGAACACVVVAAMVIK